MILISGYYKGLISLRNFEDKENVSHLHGHQSIIDALKVINPYLLASGSRDKTIKIWDLRDNKCIHTFQTLDYVQSLELINSDLIASANYDNIIRFYNIKKFECVQIKLFKLMVMLLNV